MAIESVLVLGGIASAHWVIFHKSFFWMLPPQLWRLVTPFLLTSGGIGALFDLYFTWIYGTGLELNSARFTQPGDFFVYVAFNMVVILVGFIFSSLHTHTKLALSARPAFL